MGLEDLGWTDQPMKVHEGRNGTNIVDIDVVNVGLRLSGGSQCTKSAGDDNEGSDEFGEHVDFRGGFEEG